MRWLRWALIGAWLAACPLWLGSAPSWVRLVIAGLVVAIVPGVGWAVAWAGRRGHPAVIAAMTVVAATGAMVCGAIAHALVGHMPAAWSWWLWCGVCGGVGWWWAGRTSTRLVLTRRDVWISVVAGGAAVWLYAVTAVAIVPPMADQDFEVQATSVGLLTRGEPRVATDRGVSWYLAHPPLFHVMVASTFALTGHLPDIAIHDDIARRAGEWVPAAEAEESLRVYLASPFQVESRAVAVVLSALTVGVLAMWAGRRSGRWWVALGVAWAYATSVEVVVRSSYGGYFAVSQLSVMLTLWLLQRPAAAGWTSGAWGAWVLGADHKSVLLPVGLGALQLGRPVVRRFVAGAVAGTAAFWLWGLLIAPDVFITDHVYAHLFDRLRHDNPLGYVGYPNVVALWRELARHVGPVLPIGLVLVACRVRLRPWLLFVLATAVLYSVVDWRMTKHLMPLVLVAHMALVPQRGDARPWWRFVAGVLVVQVFWNGEQLVTLIDSFEAIRVTPAW